MLKKLVLTSVLVEVLLMKSDPPSLFMSSHDFGTDQCFPKLSHASNLPAHHIFHTAETLPEGNIWNVDEKVDSPEDVFFIPKKSIPGLRSHNQP